MGLKGCNLELTKFHPPRSCQVRGGWLIIRASK